MSAVGCNGAQNLDSALIYITRSLLFRLLVQHRAHEIDRRVSSSVPSV